MISAFTSKVRPAINLVTRVMFPRHASSAQRAIAKAAWQETEEARRTIESTEQSPTVKELKAARKLYKEHKIQTFTLKQVDDGEPELYVNGEYIHEDHPDYDEYREQAEKSQNSIKSLRRNIELAMGDAAASFMRAMFPGLKVRNVSGCPCPIYCHHYTPYTTASLFPITYCTKCIPRCQTKHVLEQARKLVTELEQEVTTS